jgi:sugar phosphate permease
LLTLWFGPGAFASLAGVLVAVGSFGNMVATTPLVLLVKQMGWRSSFQVIAALNLLLVIVFYIVVRDRPARGAAGSVTAVENINIRKAYDNLIILFRQKEYWIISFATFARYGIFAAFQALWAGPYLMETRALSALRTGNLILLLNIGMIVGSPCWGALSDRLFKSRKWVVVAGSCGMALIITILAALPARSPGAVVLPVLFFSFGFFNASGLLMYPHIKELMPSEMSGAAMTGINFFTMIGPAIFLQGLGALMQALYPAASRGPAAFQTVFLVCLCFLLAVAVLYALTAEKRDLDPDGVDR